MFEIFGQKISGPFTIPSGVVASSAEVLAKLAREVPEMGILTTKSIGWQAREGYANPILAGWGKDSFVNAVGLANPGAVAFARQLAQCRWPKDKFLLVSIYGRDPEDFLRTARALLPAADGFELNLSCPHAERYGQAVGRDQELVGRIVRAVKGLGKPVVVKISPNIDVASTVKASEENGVDGFAAVNTEGPVKPLYQGQPVLSNQQGGLSGSALKKTGLETVARIRSISQRTIIACGGIRTAEDVRAYRSAGADFFGVGSALAGLSTEALKDYFKTLGEDMGRGEDQAAGRLAKGVSLDYQTFRLADKSFHQEDLFSLVADRSIDVQPGQFVYLWLPGRGEAPFSVLKKDPLTVLVKRKGCFTRALSELKTGDVFHVRGPYGQTPSVQGRILLVGGGTGLAALYLFAESYESVSALLGAKNKDHLPFAEDFRKATDRLFLMTEDGTLGKKGLVSEKLSAVIDQIRPDYCLNCGPVEMIEEAVRQEKEFLSDDRILSSVEFMTRCGIGLCGRCATPRGYRNCVDGTFLTADRLF